MKKLTDDPNVIASIEAICECDDEALVKIENGAWVVMRNIRQLKYKQTRVADIERDSRRSY